MAVLAVIYLVEIGFSNAQVGIIFGFSLAGGFVVAVGVMLTSRVIPTRIWSIANMLILAAGGIVLILSNDFWFLILGGFFGAYAASGAHWGGMMQLEQTGIAAAIPQERRTRAYSNLSIGSSAGSRCRRTTRRPVHPTHRNVPMGTISCLPSRLVALCRPKRARRRRLHAAVQCRKHANRRRRVTVRKSLQSKGATSDPYDVLTICLRLVRRRHGLRLISQFFGYSPSSTCPPPLSERH